MRPGVHGHLRFVHGLEQGRLRLGRGAIDLVGENDVGENRAGLEFKLLLDLIEDADADDVARQHIRGELDALKRTVKGMRQGLREGRFAHSGHVFDQKMASRQQGDQSQLDGLVFAANNACDGALQLRDGRRRGRGGRCGVR